MKQTINIGTVVDSGNGDYLRKGGQKINLNFEDIFDKLGNSNVLYPAGAWQKINGKDTKILNAEFGQLYIIDTLSNKVNVKLPKGNADLIGTSIKLRDAKGTWDSTPIDLTASNGDTIKGSTSVFTLNKKFQDIELVYSSPLTWQYIDNKTLSSVEVSGANAPKRASFICYEGQTDFYMPFGVLEYDLSNLQVFHRGNLLYYSSFNNIVSDDSDYGSIPNPASSTTKVPLNGKSVRLYFSPKEGDTIEFVTFLDSVTTFKSSYILRTIQVLDSKKTILKSNPSGGLFVGDLNNIHLFTTEDFGFLSSDGQININLVNLLKNGHELTKAGTGNLPENICDGFDSLDKITCESNGGTWVSSGADYSIIQNGAKEYKNIKLSESLNHGDILTIKWFNNDVGSLLSSVEIDNLVKEKYLNSEYSFDKSGAIEYTDLNNPNADTVQLNTEITKNFRISSIEQLFDQIYPVGTIYENAHNPNNPALYMGFGVWKRYADQRTLVGWNSTNPNDQNFGLNHNSSDRHVSGGTGGNSNITLNSTNIPVLTSNSKTLIEDDAGSVIIGQCEDDPGNNILNNKKYSIDNIQVGTKTPTTINILNPFITVHRWIRVK